MDDDQDQKPPGPSRSKPEPKARLPPKKYAHRKLGKMAPAQLLTTLMAKLTLWRLEVVMQLIEHPKPEGYSSEELQALIPSPPSVGPPLSSRDPMNPLWWDNLLEVHEEDQKVPRFSIREKSPLIQFFLKVILPVLLQDPEETEET